MAFSRGGSVYRCPCERQKRKDKHRRSHMRTEAEKGGTWA